MHITVNGQYLEIEPGQTLLGLILSMNLDPSVVVADLNHDIVAGDRFASTSLGPGDRLELLSFVGGGLTNSPHTNNTSIIMENRDIFEIGGKRLTSRLFTGTGKYGTDSLIPAVCESSGSEVITVALRRVDLDGGSNNVMRHIPKHMTLLPNTSGARTAEEAVRIARLARAMGCGDWIKIEVISDNRHLLPDGYETARATEILAKEGFVVLPYMNPDLYVARSLVDAGAAAIMPLGAPIGTNRGLRTEEMIRILIEEMDLPIIVDAGIGTPSQACQAMEMGAAACLVNTAIATASDPVGMGRAFGRAVTAGREAWLSGVGPVSTLARASSPLTGFLDQPGASS